MLKPKLRRAREGKKLCGVAQGISNYTNIPVSWIRIGFLWMFLTGGSGLFLYAFLAFMMPKEKK